MFLYQMPGIEFLLEQIRQKKYPDSEINIEIPHQIMPRLQMGQSQQSWEDISSSEDDS